MMSSISEYSEFWKSLDKKSEGFQKATLLEGVLQTLPFTEQDVRDVFTDLSNITEEGDLHQVNAFVGTKKCLKFGLQIAHSPPSEREDLESWLENISQETKYGIIINDLTSISDSFAKSCAMFVSYMVDCVPPPGLLFNTALIIGNYKFTPFGAHIDLPNCRIINIHLGPGKKEFLFWEPAIFERITGKKTGYFDYESISEYGYSIEVNSGDAILIPPGVVHVGRNHGFSIAIVVALQSISKGEFISESITTESFNLISEETKSQLNFEVSNCDINYQLEHHHLDEISARTWINDSIQDCILLKRSNYGLSPCDKRRVIDNRITKNSIIKRTLPFPILTCRRNNKLLVFSRHHKLSFHYSPELELTIDEIKQKELVCVSDLFKNPLNNPHKENIILDLLNNLYEVHGIEELI